MKYKVKYKHKEYNLGISIKYPIYKITKEYFVRAKDIMEATQLTERLEKPAIIKISKVRDY